MTPRLAVLCIYPLIIIAAFSAIYQCRKLATVFPSQAWIFKKRLMGAFGLWQLYGMWQSYWWSRPTWYGVASFSGTLLFLVGLNIFDRLLLRSYEKLKRHVTELSKVPQEPTAGELDESHWRKNNREDMRTVIRGEIRHEFLKE